MTYLAPRQGRFAVVILCSFCLHILFFVMSAEQSLQSRDKVVAETFLRQLSDEAVVPLSVGDDVSLAVVGERVLADPSVAYVAFYTADDELAVSVGDKVAGEGVSATVVEGERQLGKITIQTTPISRARLMGEYWLFMLSALILHSLVWLVYGYIARPTKRLQAEIARGVRDKLLAQQLLPNQRSAQFQTQTRQTPPPDEPVAPSAPTDNALPKPESRTFGAKSTVSSFLKNHLKSEPSLDEEVGETEISENVDTADDSEELSDTKNMTVQVAFVDKYGLLEMLIEERGQVYFALCNQMLQKVLLVASRHPVFIGVHIVQTTPLNEHGTHIYLEKRLPTANLAKATATLTKLIVMVGQVVYNRHRDLGLFALPIKAIASDDTRLLIAQRVLEKHHEALILMNAKDVELIAGVMNLSALPSPVGIYEKECRVLGAVSEELARALIELRREVLSAE